MFFNNQILKNEVDWAMDSTKINNLFVLYQSYSLFIHTVVKINSHKIKHQPILRYLSRN
jgi:hypothetical protein